MKRFIKNIITICLLIILSVTIIPLDYFHHHTPVEVTPDSISDDQISCYNSINKPFDNLVNHCNHKNHLNLELENCFFCSLQFLNNINYLFNSQSSDTHGYFVIFQQPEDILFTDLIQTTCSTNRGPPC